MPHLSIGPAYRAEAELTKKLDEMKKIEEKGLMELRVQVLEKDSTVRRLEKRVEEQSVRLSKAEEAYANATIHDPVMNRLFRDKRFRRDVFEAIGRLSKVR